MPKPTKLHSKGKTNSIQKPCKTDTVSSDASDPEESAKQFQLELCWCIQQLEKTITDKKGDQKRLQEAWKVLTVLKNNNQPVIRKRQLMRTHFGDYRTKMAAEEKKLAKMASKIKISDTPGKAKATFLRKSAFLTTGNDSFRFNFNLGPDQIDNGRPEGHVVTRGNISCVENVNNDSQSNTNSNNFKFTFTESAFKFNFKPDDII